jgi:hypothetical protein
VASSVPNNVFVTYSTTSAAELAALAEILRQVSAKGDTPVTYREGKGVLYIEPGPLPGQAQLAVAKAVTGNRRTTNYSVVQRRLKTVAKELSDVYGATVTVAPNVPDLPVTFSINGATLEQALEVLMKAARGSLPNLNIRSSANSYVLEMGM